MLKLIAGLGLLAGLLMLAVALTMPDGATSAHAIAPASRAQAWMPDLRSFAAGIVLGVIVAWVCAFPWRHLPQVMLYWTRVWRRRIALLVFGALFAGILLYY